MAWEDRRHWQDSDEKIAAELMGLIEQCRLHPFRAAGKPAR
jgi:Txe/YoeB family toxin of Txe-Axe toxin-antitoxin module